MRRYVVRRLLQAVVTLWLLTLFVFLLMRILPGNIAYSIYEDSVTPELVAGVRAKLGLDKPLYAQYWTWVNDAARLNLRSFFGDKPVIAIVRDALPVTINLTAYSVLITMLIAVPMGVLSALKRETLADYLIKVVAVVGLSMPTFWVGVLIIFGLVYFFGWFPGLMWVSPLDDPLRNFSIMIWPALAMAWVHLAVIARMTRSAMLEVLNEDYVRTARSKGLHERVVIVRHALRNALIPVVTLVGIQAARALGGSMVVEKVFNLRGIGWYTITSVEMRDYAVAEGLILLAGFMVIAINLLVDLLYARLDPRITYR